MPHGAGTGLVEADEAHRSRFRVAGMDCASCASKVESAVRRISGVADVSVSTTAGRLTDISTTVTISGLRL